MKNLDRLRGAITASVLVAGSAAYAQQADPTLTDPPQAGCEPQLGAQCPPQGQQPMPPHGTAETTTTTTTVETAPPPPPPDVYAVQQHPSMWYERLGFGLALGGGVADFVSDDYRSFTDIGGGWTLRATVGTQFPIAFEGSYVGSAQGINALGLDSDAVLISNGLQGAARLNVITGYAVQPFLFGGAAWRHFDLTNEGINTSDIRDSDDVLEVPVGLGFAGYIGEFMADVRGEYRMSFFDDLIPFATDNGALIGAGDAWDVTATIGMQW